MHRSIFTNATRALAIVGLAALMGCGGEPDSNAERPAAASTARATAASARATTGSNRAPTVESVTITPSVPSAADTLRTAVEVGDPDGDPVEVRITWWVNGRRAGEGSSFTPEDGVRGSHVEVSVVARDGHHDSTPVTASVTLGNTAPTLSGIRFEPSGPWSAGQRVAAVPEATDPDNDPLTFEYTWYVNGQPIADDGPILDGARLGRGDEVQLAVIASDGHAPSDELRTEPMKIANAAPEIVSEPGAIDADGVFRYALRATDPDGDRGLLHRIVQGPSGAEMDRLQGQLVWRPDESQSGPQAFVLEVDDRMGGKTTQSFTLDVSFDRAPASPASPR